MNALITKLPSNPDDLINSAIIALGGVRKHDSVLNLGENNLAGFSQFLAGLVGGHINGTAGPGILGAYQSLFLTGDNLRKALQDAETAAEQFDRGYMDGLKIRVGREFNGEWKSAGFPEGIHLPGDPVRLLDSAVNYLKANPAREFIEDGITAARAEAVRSALVAARDALSDHRSDMAEAVQRRLAGIRQLRKRMTGLRNTLTMLLPPDSPVWYDFGFRRPIDGKMPEPVEGLMLLFVAPAGLLARWNPAARARNYRVSVEVNEEEIATALTKEPHFYFEGLPAGPGVMAVVRVTAVNKSGETAPAEAHVALQS